MLVLRFSHTLGLTDHGLMWKKHVSTEKIILFLYLLTEVSVLLDPAAIQFQRNTQRPTLIC